jgi:hypothetical protein
MVMHHRGMVINEIVVSSSRKCDHMKPAFSKWKNVCFGSLLSERIISL